MRLSGPPVRMSSGFVPACLPEEPVAPGQVVAVVGWGRTWRKSRSKKLKVVRGNSVGNRHVSKKITLIRLIWWKTGKMTALAKKICLNWDSRYCYFLREIFSTTTRNIFDPHSPNTSSAASKCRNKTRYHARLKNSELRHMFSP